MPTTNLPSVLTQAHLNKIREAIALGHKKLRLNNREIEYQSVSQMIHAADWIENQLREQANSGKRRPKMFRGRMASKGL